MKYGDKYTTPTGASSADPITAYERRQARGWWMVFAAGVAAIVLIVAIYFIG